ALDGRVETEANIAETEDPVEVEGIGDLIAAGGDVRHGPLGVLGDAELADEVVAAAAGDDAQRGVRIDEAGRNRPRHPVTSECAHAPCAICGEAGGELLCVLLARASDEPRLATVCGKGPDQRIDSPRE